MNQFLLIVYAEHENVSGRRCFSNARNGLEAIPRIRKESPSTHILVLSMHDEEELIHRTLEAGASGYILKSDAGPSLLSAAYAVLSGRTFVSPSVTPVVLNRSYESESQSK